MNGTVDDKVMRACGHTCCVADCECFGCFCDCCRSCIWLQDKETFHGNATLWRMSINKDSRYKHIKLENLLNSWGRYEEARQNHKSVQHKTVLS